MYQKLFDYLNKQFGITPVETELQEIERLLLISENSWRVPVDVSVLSNLIEGSEMFGHAIIDGYQHLFDPQNQPD